MHKRLSRAVAPVVQLTLVKLREYTREPEALFWVFFFPIIMTLALGLAFRDSGGPVVRIGVVSGERSAAIAAALNDDPRTSVTEMDPAAADAALRDGHAAVIVEARDVGDAGSLTYRYDASRPDSAAARYLVDDILQRAGGRRDAFPVADEAVQLPGSRYIDWLVPGLLGMNIMTTGVWGIGFSIGMARAKKLIKRLSATPMRRSHFLLAQIGGRLLFLPLEAGALIVFGHYVFGVPVNGSWLLLSALILLGAVSGAALSLFVASRARSFEAISGLLNFAVLPMWILSGVFFSATNFPAVMQPFVQALPLTALNDALRAVMLSGAGPAAVAGEAAIVLIWTLVCFGVALRIFRWQ